ncbi:MAG: hypothetical protein AB7F64_04410 [Gammaproteobacteria bacterium]
MLNLFKAFSPLSGLSLTEKLQKLEGLPSSLWQFFFINFVEPALDVDAEAVRAQAYSYFKSHPQYLFNICRTERLGFSEKDPAIEITKDFGVVYYVNSEASSSSGSFHYVENFEVFKCLFLNSVRDFADNHNIAGCSADMLEIIKFAFLQDIDVKLLKTETGLKKTLSLEEERTIFSSGFWNKPAMLLYEKQYKYFPDQFFFPKNYVSLISLLFSNGVADDFEFIRDDFYSNDDVDNNQFAYLEMIMFEIENDYIDAGWNWRCELIDQLMKRVDLPQFWEALCFIPPPEAGSFANIPTLKAIAYHMPHMYDIVEDPMSTTGRIIYFREEILINYLRQSEQINLIQSDAFKNALCAIPQNNEYDGAIKSSVLFDLTSHKGGVEWLVQYLSDVAQADFIKSDAFKRALCAIVRYSVLRQESALSSLAARVNGRAWVEEYVAANPEIAETEAYSLWRGAQQQTNSAENPTVNSLLPSSILTSSTKNSRKHPRDDEDEEQGRETRKACQSFRPVRIPTQSCR